MPLRDGAGDAAHFPSEFEVIVARAHAVLVECCDGSQLQSERKRQEPEKKPGKLTPRAEALIFFWLLPRR
jgi:hypothetical protein